MVQDSPPTILPPPPSPPESFEEDAPRRRALGWRIARWVGYAFAALLALIVLLIVFLNTPPGRQFIVNQISSYAPASGLSVDVGKIDGSILYSATLHDVKFRDSKHVLFLEVPEIDLNWRPWEFLWSGLDIRHLALSNGTLYAAPDLIPGDPDAPTLPNFDIRIDRLVIDHLTVAKGMLGEQRVIDFRAKTNIKDGLVYIDANGAFGGGDVFTALVNAEPDGNRFDLDLNYRAPKGGFLAALVGAKQDLAMKLAGDGTWTAWAGKFNAVQGGANIADLSIYNQSGQYRIVGQVRPESYLEGLPASALGKVVELNAEGTLENSVLDGTFTMRGRAIDADAKGAIDLNGNVFHQVVIEAQLLDPTLFGNGMKLDNASVQATLDGKFSDLTVPHKLQIGELDANGTIVRGLVQQGTLTYDGTRYTLPVNATVQRIVSGNAMADPRLVNGRVNGTIVYTGNQILSDNLAVRFPGLGANLAIKGDLSRGAFEVAGPVNAQGLALENIGTIDANARIRFGLGQQPWHLAADFSGRVRNVTNSTLVSLAGQPIRFSGGVSLGGASPIVFRNTKLNAPLLNMTLNGRVENGRTTLTGSGSQAQYGSFTVEGEMGADGPRAVLVFADPLPAAGLANVRVALSPTKEGFRIETTGGSMLGAFDGLVNLNIPASGDIRIGIEHFDVSQTRITGNLALADGGVAGSLALARGGVDGTVALSTRNGGQAFDANVKFNNARFGGATPIAINQGTLDASGFIGAGNTTVMGQARIAGLGYGTTFLRRVALNAQVNNGSGTFDGAIAGQRGSRFEMLLNGQVAPDRIAVVAKGKYAGRDITMPRRAVVTRTPDGGWQLAKTQLGYAGGYTIVEGRFGGTKPMQGTISLSKMPLSLVDALGGDLGVGGTISGLIDMSSDANGQPVGSAKVMVNGLTRSGLVLTSQPVDLAFVGDLSSTLLQARAVMKNDAGINGRLQARIADLPATGSLSERLFAGDLLAQFRYDGPAASLWRLAALDILDITGQLNVAADVRGSLGNPRVQGSMAGDDLRVQSALTGTDVKNVKARGRFTGSRFVLSSFSGTAPNGGQVSGSGSIDLAGMSGSKGPQMDLRLAARNARIMDLPAMGATVTGPMRIVSNGVGGTIAARLQIQGARWRLGGAAATTKLPNVPVREINLPPDITPTATTTSPWRYLIDANAEEGIKVDGMGLDSEWRGNVRLRGTTDAPTIGGEVQVVPRQGFYSFAGSRFEITRGRIYFDEESPPDPRIDLVAESTINGLAVAVNVMGTASQPDITFTSTPALPEEELLARILFGGSVTNLSATDALQLGSALASLRGGSGVGPINKLRNAIGLDRLRIVGADPALDRGTSIALGKNITRRLYAEVITDGANYNATNLEFRVTSWLSLLSSISTVGRQSVSAQYSKDY